MAEKNMRNDEDFSEEGLPASPNQDAYPETEDLYETELTRYQAQLDEDMEKAFERYGFTLFHSLPGLKLTELADKLGFAPQTAADYYNLAGLALSKEDYATAAKHLNKALELNESLEPAIYNLALCYEKLGRNADAVALWQRYLELVDVEEERQPVLAHLNELKA